MIYTHKNALGAKVCDERGQEIEYVRWVDTDRNVIAVLDDPPKLNATRTDVIEHEIAFERIEISKRCPQTNLLKESRCYGRLSG